MFGFHQKALSEQRLFRVCAATLYSTLCPGARPEPTVHHYAKTIITSFYLYRKWTTFGTVFKLLGDEASIFNEGS